MRSYPTQGYTHKLTVDSPLVEDIQRLSPAARAKVLEDFANKMALIDKEMFDAETLRKVGMSYAEGHFNELAIRLPAETPKQALINDCLRRASRYLGDGDYVEAGRQILGLAIGLSTLHYGNMAGAY